MSKDNFILPPKKLPFLIKFATRIAEKKTKKQMEIPKLLAWDMKTAISSGILEASITHNDKQVSDRMLQLVRIQVAAIVGCDFCLDMNTSDTKKNDITKDELSVLYNCSDLDSCKTFTVKEQLAVEYARVISSTPVQVSDLLREEIKLNFSEREIVVLCATISQVNYWTRLAKGLDVSTACPIEQ